jgi:hypothetical protein
VLPGAHDPRRPSSEHREPVDVLSSQNEALPGTRLRRDYAAKLIVLDADDPGRRLLHTLELITGDHAQSLQHIRDRSDRVSMPFDTPPRGLHCPRVTGARQLARSHQVVPSDRRAPARR